MTKGVKKQVNEEVLEQVAEMLAGEMDGVGDDLDSLESGVLGLMQQVARRTFQKKLERDKKRATQAAAGRARAGRKPGL